MPSSALAQPTLQSYDFFLVLDVEATCQEGAGMDYPNEIIASASKSYLLPWLTVSLRNGLSAYSDGETRPTAFWISFLSFGLLSNLRGDRGFLNSAHV